MRKRANLLLAIAVFLFVIQFGLGLEARAGSIVGCGVSVVDGAELVRKDYIAIAAGNEHNLALKSDGSIVGWVLKMRVRP